MPWASTPVVWGYCNCIVVGRLVPPRRHGNLLPELRSQNGDARADTIPRTSIFPIQTGRIYKKEIRSLTVLLAPSHKFNKWFIWSALLIGKVMYAWLVNVEFQYICFAYLFHFTAAFLMLVHTVKLHYYYRDEYYSAILSSIFIHKSVPVVIKECLRHTFTEYISPLC